LIKLHVIASEAKQSSASPSLLDCFVADAPRNDESVHYESAVVGVTGKM
jgi:hypothetical protein